METKTQTNYDILLSGRQALICALVALEAQDSKLGAALIEMTEGEPLSLSPDNVASLQSALTRKRDDPDMGLTGEGRSQLLALANFFGSVLKSDPGEGVFSLLAGEPRTLEQALPNTPDLDRLPREVRKAVVVDAERKERFKASRGDGAGLRVSALVLFGGGKARWVEIALWGLMFRDAPDGAWVAYARPIGKDDDNSSLALQEWRLGSDPDPAFAEEIETKVEEARRDLLSLDPTKVEVQFALID